MYFRILLFTLLLVSCAPERQQVEAHDLKRVLERFAQNRIQTGITATETKGAPSDKALFEEACEVYRLSLPKAKDMLKNQNPELFESIYGNE
ncbi:MAG: hypothetical protein MUF77_03715 [Leptospira sp.]|jgi:hypothetical protein|nr:hypothetical protein [Leptospira sp.]